ncbi:MAG: OsmC family protein [Coriobacteriales bacterium]|jgi:uncharacterized OsmC-like protein|nr:OsmC family protein [Coriobacteriales bacterium]
MKQTVRASTKKVPGGLKVDTKARSFTLICDEPTDSGGTDEGMTPVEALLGSLGSCMTIAAFILAGQKSIILKDFSVDIEGDLDPDGFLGINEDVRKGFSEIRLSIQLVADGDPSEVEAFARFVESRCPVGDTLSGGVPITCQSITVRQ